MEKRWPHSFYLLISVFFALFIASCSQTEQTGNANFSTFSKPFIQRIHQDSINLEWSEEAASIDSVSQYLILYRPYPGTTALRSLGTATGTSTRFLIRRSALPAADSLFELAVRAISNSGDTSTILLSTDFQATYNGGWIIHWK